MDNKNNSITINFNDALAIECFNKFKEKHGFKNDIDVIVAAYGIMLFLDEENSIHFLKNGKFIVFPKGTLK